MPANAKADTPPYIPYGTLKNYAVKLQEAGPLPAQIDKGMMQHLSGGMQSQLMSAMKFLQLIKSGGEKTESLEKLVAAAGKPSWADALGGVLRTAYRGVFDDIDLKSATTGQVQQKFNDLYGVDGSTKDRSVAFFVNALKAAKIQTSAHLKPPKLGSKKSSKSKQKKDGGEGGKDDNREQPRDTPVGFIEFPIHLFGREPGKIIVPRDLKVSEVALVKLAMNYVEEYAKQVEGAKDIQDEK